MTISQDELLKLIKEYAPELPPNLALSIYEQESGSGKNTNHPPKGGAIGGFGVTPGAAKDVGIDPALLKDPRVNAIAGIKYLNKQFIEAGKDPFAAAARYFGGPAAMSNLSIADETGKTRGDYAKEVLNRAGLTSSQISGNSQISVNSSTANVPTDLFNQMMSAFGVSKESNIQSIDAIDKATKNYSFSIDTAIAAHTKSGEAQRDYILDVANQKIMKAGVAANNAAIAGLDKTDINNIFALTVREFQQNAEEVRILSNAVKDAEQISFGDDPLQFLQNQFVNIPQLTMAHNQSVRVANTNFQRLTALNQMVQTQNVTDNATIADISIKGAIAHADQMVQKSIIEAEQLRMAGETTLAGLFVNRNKIVAGELNEVQQLAQMKALEDYRSQVRESAKDAEKVKNLKLEDQQKFEKDLGTLGYTIETFKGLKKENQDRIGQMIATGRLGDTPMDAILGLKLIPRFKISAGQKELVELFSQIYQTNVATNPLYTKPAQQVEAGDKAIKTTLDQQRENPTIGEKNVFRIPSPSVMQELVKANTQISSVFKNVIKILSDTTQGTQVDDFAIIQTVTTQIGEQGYTREMAINDLSLYYKLGIQANNSKYQYKDFGVLDQSSYRVSIKIPNYIPAANKDKETPNIFNSSTGIFGTNIKADLANELAVSNIVTLLQAQKFSRLGRIPQVFSESRKDVEGLGLLTPSVP